MSKLIHISEFFAIRNNFPLIDVRSPAEYEQGHIPGAISIPLFNNEERAKVGTLYKNSGQKDAILAGVDIAGRKMRKLAELALKIAPDKQVIVHCWRGGMRSASMAWLFETCGIQCYIISGGYKVYRNFIRGYFGMPFRLIVIGGMTGSGKSAILDKIENLSFQVLKLEKIAHHKGSAFGNLGEHPQSTNEQFENNLFEALLNFDIDKPVFVEDESRNIGRNIIPPVFFDRISISPLIVVEMDKGLRISRLVKEYGLFSTNELRSCIEKISKRLGGLNTQSAITFLEMGQIEEAAGISLGYYDKAYKNGLARKTNSKVIKVELINADEEINAYKIIEVLKYNDLI